jgi:hypothetical protein
VKQGSERRESGLSPISGGESSVESDTINALEAYGEPPIAASLRSVDLGASGSGVVLRGPAGSDVKERRSFATEIDS